jgi:hypothetical protein
MPSVEKDGGDGPRVAALGIAVAMVGIMVLLPFLVVVGFYTFANVQALITGSDLSSRTLSIPVFLIVLVGTVVLLVLGLFGVVSLIGRSFSPKRRDDEEVALFLEPDEA